MKSRRFLRPFPLPDDDTIYHLSGLSRMRIHQPATRTDGALLESSNVYALCVSLRNRFVLSLLYIHARDTVMRHLPLEFLVSHRAIVPDGDLRHVWTAECSSCLQQTCKLTSCSFVVFAWSGSPHAMCIKSISVTAAPRFSRCT